jgi:Glycosyl transferase family 2/Dolichyl-phosphate-mannose-protein mannosyltransferase
MVQQANRVALAIPAYRPSDRLIQLAETLSQAGFAAIVIVDDGSGDESRRVFEKAETFPGVRVLRHAVPLGTGAALKTAFNHILCHLPDLTGVVTAGEEHSPDDIERVAARLVQEPTRLVLGCRKSGARASWRQRAGGWAVNAILRTKLGRTVSDLQSGLRGIPAAFLPQAMRVEAAGPEYEIEMLVAAHTASLGLAEEPVAALSTPDDRQPGLAATLQFAARLAGRRTRTGDAPAESKERPRRTGPVYGWGIALLFLGFAGLTIYGILKSDLFSQRIWEPAGLARAQRYAEGFFAITVPLLLIVPWTLPAFFLVALTAMTAVTLGPVAVLATAFFLASASALGAGLMRAGDESGEDHLLSMLLGMGVYMLLMTALARLPVNYPAMWGTLLLLPILIGWRGVLNRARYWLRAVRSAELRGAGTRTAFVLLFFVLIAQWFAAMMPEISTDSLAMHLAIPMNIAVHHRMTFEPSRYVWAVAPMGADWCYSIVYLLGGEGAAHLLVWCMLAAIAGLLYCALRRVASAAAALLLAALFAATPLVQLVTGSLFVENIQAALVLGMVIALWRFAETSERRFLYLAMTLGGTAMSIKVGSAAFLVPALIVAAETVRRNWKALGPRPWAACALAAVLVLATGIPAYAIAYVKTADPLFPYFFKKFPSPLLDPSLDFTDSRFREPLRLSTIYDLTFQTSRYYEGQRGSLGFPYLAIAPLALAGLFVVRRWLLAGAALVCFGAGFFVLRWDPNARYLYAVLPVLMLPFGGLLGWMAGRQLWLYRLVLLFLAGCLGMNLAFLPSSGYYHKDFSLRRPFSQSERQRYIREAAPVRDVVAYFNREHPNSGVLFTEDPEIAGVLGDVYENMWHQISVYERILHTETAPAMMELMKSWNIQYFIARKPALGDPIHPPALAKLIEVCTAPEYELGERYLAKLDTNCDPATAQPPSQPSIVVPPGYYDEADPAIFYRGQWRKDQSFEGPDRHTLSYSDQPDAEAAFAFDGKVLNWVHSLGPDRGIAEVFVDQTSKGPVDLYAPDLHWDVRTPLCCTEPGRHTVVIRVTGQAHPRSSGHVVDIDSLRVE